MKKTIYAILAFVALILIGALIRGVTKSVVGPGLLTVGVNLLTTFAVLYFPYKIYTSEQNKG